MCICIQDYDEKAKKIGNYAYKFKLNSQKINILREMVDIDNLDTDPNIIAFEMVFGN